MRITYVSVLAPRLCDLCLNVIDVAFVQDLRRAADQRANRQFWKLFLFTLFLIYPSVSSMCLRLFVCRNINGTDYLLADFTLECYDSQWRQYAYIDIFFIALYPVGIPVFFFLLLWTNRKRLTLPDIRIELGFLYEAYSADFWWFELVDMMNKLFLTSFLAFFPSESQLPVGFAWSLAYVDVLLIAKPYVRKGDDRLHLFAQTAIACILLAGKSSPCLFSCSRLQTLNADFVCWMINRLCLL